MKVFIVSEKSYEIKQVKDFLERLPYSQYLKEEPLAFYSEDNPQQALTRLAEDAQKGVFYDIAVVAAKMKILTGLRFARSVTTRENMPSLPVALIVDNINKEFLKEAFAHGVSGFIEVPFTAEGMQDSMTMLALTIAAREKKKLGQELEKLKAKDTPPEIIAGIYQKSAGAARRAILAAPWSKEAWLEVADVHMEAGRHHEAIPLIKSSLKINFDYPEAHRALLTCYKKTGQCLEELAALRRMVAANPKSPELLIRTGEELLRESNYREAALFFKKAIMNIKPNDPKRLRARVHVGYGKTLAQEGDAVPDPQKHREASEEFKKAIVADPAMVSAYMNLIGVYKKLGMPAEARALLEKAAKITPDSADGWLELFAWYLREGEMQKAKFSLERAMQLDPENQITLIAAGEVYLREQLHGEAAALFEKALAVNPSDTRIYNYLGITYRRMEMNEQAVNCFTKAICIDKDDCNLYFNLGRAYQQKPDAAKARQAYEAALRINAEFAEAKMALQSLINGGAAPAPKAATA
ncbi:MAG: tetratricopeptide repeat protein [Nitrospinae bacterium]|nr:tetratricopeptide repeat protein [Nitrospinota bacterium]